MNTLKFKSAWICRLLLYAIILMPCILALLLLFTGIGICIILALALFLFEIFLFIKYIPEIMTFDMMLEHICHWQKDRLFFTSASNGSGAQIFDSVLKRVNVYGNSVDIEKTSKGLVCVRHKRVFCSEAFYSSVEKNAIVYKVDCLDTTEIKAILSASKGIAESMKGLTKPYFYLTKKERKAPFCRVFLVLVFANEITEDVIAIVRKERESTHNFFMPCVIDLSNGRYYFDGMKEVHFSGMEGKPSKNMAINFINRLVFNGAPDLKNNENMVPGVISEELLEEPFFRAIKESIIDSQKEKIIKKKIYKNISNNEVFEKDNEIYICIEGRITTFLIFENEELDKIELAVSGFWDYPRRNPISKKDLVKVKEKAVEHFRKQNKKVDFIDMQE